MRMPKTFYKKDIVNAIVETPKDSHFKYDYDPELKAFAIKKSLPQGMHFPFNFGFIPNTLGRRWRPARRSHSGRISLAVGALARLKIIGVLEAEADRKG